MKIIINLLRRFIVRQNPTDEQITSYIKSKIIAGGGRVGNNFDLIASSIDLSTPYLLSIGDNVTLSGVKILTHDASLKKTLGYSKVGEVHIGNNVFIGWGTIVLMNTRIGNNVIIGAGSVVCNDIPENSVAVGNPCKVICSYEEYMTKMQQKMREVPVIDQYPHEITDTNLKESLINSGYGFVL